MMRLKRCMALLLALLLLFGALPSYAFATEVDEETNGSDVSAENTDEPGQDSGEQESANDPEKIESLTENTGSEGTEEQEQSDTVIDQDTTPEGDEETQQEQIPEFTDIPSDSEQGTDEGEQTELDTPLEPEGEGEAEQTGCVLDITEKKELSLRYDDRYSFDDLLPGYGIVHIENRSIESFQVRNGKNTGKHDLALLKQNDQSDINVTAVGVGHAEVLLAPLDELEAAKEAYQAQQQQQTDSAPSQDEEREPEAAETQEQEATEAQQLAETKKIFCTQVDVTIEPARLSVLFLAGQSNMEGMCNGGYRPENSVECPAGQVYSTYTPSNYHATSITGISSFKQVSSPIDGKWSKAVAPYVADSLTGTNSISGTKLVYPLNALTAEGKGKTGPDSGIAYEWNRLTGDKVWVINASWSGSSIRYWTSGGDYFERAKAVYTSCLGVLKSEVQAKHFIETGNSRMMFWLQGEADKGLSAKNYLDRFNSMRRDFVKYCGVKSIGIISVRAANSASGYVGMGDLRMTGPRIAQYCMANSTASSYSKIFVVSNVNENWTSDRMTADYFRKAYPGGKPDYPVHEDGRVTLAHTEQEVHPFIHYTQLGHNENGLTAARGLYEALKGLSTPASVSWRNGQGETIKSLNIKAGVERVAIPVVNPISASKKVKCKSSSSELVYDGARGIIQAKKTGYYYFRAYRENKVIATLHVGQLATPSGIKTVNLNGGVRVTWQPVKSAAKYRVFYKTSNGTWMRAGTTKATSLDVKGLKGGVAYAFTVRCISNDETVYTSNYNAKGVAIRYIAPPVIETARAGKSTVKVTWAPAKGAVKYRVFYKTGKGVWQIAGDTTSTSFTISKLKKGTYTFTVRCISKDRKSYTSYYDTVGKTVRVG